jgi:hypothetical protein
MDRAIFHAHCNTTKAFTIIAHDEVQGKVLNKEEAVILQCHSVESVKNRMPCPVGSCSTTVCLTTFPKLQALATKSTLINLSFWGT